MNLRYIEIIHALMRSPSMTEAAQSLNISQPAASIMLKRAESQLGFKLFQRTAGRLHPTSEALALKDELDNIIARVETLKRMAHDLREGQTGSLAIAASPSLVSGYLPSVVATFQKEHRQASIDIQSVPSLRVVHMVSRREVDLGFSYHTPPDLTTSVEIIGTASISCIVPTNNPLSEQSVIGPSDLADANVITYADHTPFGRLIRKTFEKAKIPLQVAIEVHSSAEATFLVMAGAGIALVDPIMTKPYTLPSIAVKPFQPEVSVPLQLVFAKGRPQSRAVVQFAHALRVLRK